MSSNNRKNIKPYDGNVHVFYSDDCSDNVYLRAGQGQKLVVEGATSGSPAGSNTDVQFNKNGEMGADSDFTYNYTSKKLTVNNLETDNITASNDISTTYLTVNNDATFSADIFANANVLVNNELTSDTINAVSILTENFYSSGFSNFFDLHVDNDIDVTNDVSANNIIAVTSIETTDFVSSGTSDLNIANIDQLNTDEINTGSITSDSITVDSITSDIITSDSITTNDLVVINDATFNNFTANGTFSVSSIGANKTVIYNDSDQLVGSQNFNYDGTYLSVLTGGIKSNNFYGSTTTDSLGYNEIFRGAGPQNCVTAFTSNYLFLGTDVSMAKDVNYVSFSAPKFVFGASDGGISIWNETSGTFNEYGSILTFSNFTFDADVKWTAINDDASVAVLCDLDDSIGGPYATTFTRSGSVWSTISIYSPCIRVRLTGSGLSTKMLTFSKTDEFYLVNWNGTDWTSKITLFNAASSPSLTRSWPIAITSSFAYIGHNNTIRKYNLSGVLQTTISLTNLSSLDAYGSTLLCYVEAGDLYIVDNGATTFIDVDIGQKCCTNGTYVFLTTSFNTIRIYSKVNGVWTKSTNDTTLTGMTGQISCNANYLAIGRPGTGTYGTGTIYKIEPYTNSGIIVNTLNLNNSNKTSLNSSAGVDITGNVSITGSMNCTNGYAEVYGTGIQGLVTGWNRVTSSYLNTISTSGISPPSITNGRITVTKAGTYLVGFNVAVQIGATSNAAMITKNVVGSFAYSSNLNTVDRSGMNGTWLFPNCIVNDYFDIFIFVGANKNTETGGGTIPGYFYAYMIA
jgi:hypothetical protein